MRIWAVLALVLVALPLTAQGPAVRGRPAGAGSHRRERARDPEGSWSSGTDSGGCTDAEQLHGGHREGQGISAAVPHYRLDDPCVGADDCKAFLARRRPDRARSAKDRGRRERTSRRDPGSRKAGRVSGGSPGVAPGVDGTAIQLEIDAYRAKLQAAVGTTGPEEKKAEQSGGRSGARGRTGTVRPHAGRRVPGSVGLDRTRPRCSTRRPPGGRCCRELGKRSPWHDRPGPARGSRGGTSCQARGSAARSRCTWSSGGSISG